mgnify:CR=1 FL=1
MINLRPLIEQRILDQTTAFKEVAGATGLQNLKENRLNYPAAYVMHERLAPNSNQSLSDTLQPVNETVSVVIVVRNVADARGTDAADDCFALRTDLQAALLNWKPHPSYSKLRYAGGNLISFANGLYLWKDSFITQTIIQG